MTAGGKPKKAAKKTAAKKPAKKTATKKPAKKAATKTAAKKRKANPALMQPYKPDAVLAAVVGSKPLPRGQITKKLWAYIKKKNLQDPKQGQYILAKKDPALRKLMGEDRVFMMKLAGIINKHITKA